MINIYDKIENKPQYQVSQNSFGDEIGVELITTGNFRYDIK